MRRYNPRGIFTLFVFWVWLSAGAQAGASDDGAAELAGVVYRGDLSTMVADARGYFADFGAAVDVTYGTSGKANLAELRAGEVDFALMALTPLVIDRLGDPTPGRGDDPVILTNLAHGIGLNHVVVLDATSPEPAAALGGSTFGLVAGTNAAFVWSLFQADQGIDPATITTSPLAIEEVLPAFVDGRISAAAVWEPWTSRLRARFGKRLHVFSTTAIYTGKWVLVTRRALVRDRPEFTRDILRAYHRAVHWIQANPEAADAIYRRRIEGDGDPSSGHKADLIYNLSLDWSLVSGLLQQRDWAAEAGYGDPPLNPLDLIAAGPLREVEPSNVHVPRASNRAEARKLQP